MNDLYSAAVLLLLIIGLSLAAAKNAGVTIQFAEETQTSGDPQTPDGYSHPAEDHSQLPDHGHTHGHSGD